MDAKLEPLEVPQENTKIRDDKQKKSTAAETSKTNIALRVGMYCLTVLNHLMDLHQSNQVLSLAKIQDAIRDNLAYFADKHPQTDFIVVVDGLNQALDPGGILGALPTEVLDNLYILVSSQPQERVRQPLEIYTQKAWQLADISELAATEAEDIVWYYWTQTIAEQTSPQRADLPNNLLERLCEASNNVPVFLEEWTKGLRNLWADDPSQFANKAEAHFEQYHNTLPEFLRSRLEELKRDFNPPYLLNAILWCLSLIQKPLSINELHSAIQTLRQEGLLANLPTISSLEIEDALRQSRIGGFVQRRKIGLSEGWQLSHEVLGQWFCEHHVQVEELPKLRLVLVPFGAIPFAAVSEENAMYDMYEPAIISYCMYVENELPNDIISGFDTVFLWWLQIKGYGYYERLSPELKVSILDNLLTNLSKHDSEYAMVVTRLFFVFWDETGEKDRALALRPALNDALSNSDGVNKKVLLRALKLSKRYLRVKRFRQLVRIIQKFLYLPSFLRYNKFSQS